MTLTAYVESILFETDRPEVVLARDAAGTVYLSLLVSRDESGDRFLSVAASPSRLAALRTGTIDLRAALERGETGTAFAAQFAFVNDRPAITLEAIPEIPPTWLPKAGFVLSDFLPAVPVDMVSLANDAISKNSSVGVLELHPPEADAESVIDFDHLVDALRLFQGLLHHAYAKATAKAEKLEKLLMGGDGAAVIQVLPTFAKGSFRVHFQSKQRADLSGSTGVGIALTRLDELTGFIDNPADALDVMKQNSGHVVSAYKALLHFVATEKTPLAYSWSEPGIQTPRRRHISVASAQKTYDILSAKTELASEEVEFTGTFSKLTEEGKWLLRSGKQQVRGKIADGAGNLLAGVVYQTKEYRIVCDEKLEEKIGSKAKKTLYLKQVPEPV